MKKIPLSAKYKEVHGGAVIIAEWPGGAGPFAWRLSEDGVELMGRTDSYALSVAPSSSLECAIVLRYPGIPDPADFKECLSICVATIPAGHKIGGGWLNHRAEPFDFSEHETSGSGWESPCTEVMGLSFEYNEIDSDKAVLQVAWPGTPGPFAWRLSEDGVELKNKWNEYIIPIEINANKVCGIYMTAKGFPNPTRGIDSYSFDIADIPAGHKIGGEWLNHIAEPFDFAVHDTSGAGREPPCAEVLGIFPEGLREDGVVYIQAPSFDPVFPFTAKLDPEGAWIILESPKGERACVDLTSFDNGSCRWFAWENFFESLRIRLSTSCHVPPYETPLIMPEDWEPRRWARKWANPWQKSHSERFVLLREEPSERKE